MLRPTAKAFRYPKGNPGRKEFLLGFVKISFCKIQCLNIIAKNQYTLED